MIKQRPQKIAGPLQISILPVGIDGSDIIDTLFTDLETAPQPQKTNYSQNTTERLFQKRSDFLEPTNNQPPRNNPSEQNVFGEKG